MRKNGMFLLICLLLLACVQSSCSEDEMAVTYGDYELACVENGTKNPIEGNVLRVSALGSSPVYEISVRRQILADGIFTGKYDYARVAHLSAQSEAERFAVRVCVVDEYTARLEVQAEENRDCLQSLSGVVRISCPDGDFQVRIEQQPAVQTFGDDWFVIYTGYEEGTVYFDNRGCEVTLEAGLAGSRYINGKADEQLWCNEDCTMTYKLSETEWFTLEEVSEKVPGIYSFRLKAQPDPLREDHYATLRLDFELDGKVYSKDIPLLSTFLFTVGGV